MFVTHIITFCSETSQSIYSQAFFSWVSLFPLGEFGYPRHGARLVGGFLCGLLPGWLSGVLFCRDNDFCLYLLCVCVCLTYQSLSVRDLFVCGPLPLSFCSDVCALSSRTFLASSVADLRSCSYVPFRALV